MTTATPAFWGQNSLFIPEFTGRVVGFIRDEKQFALMKYAEMVKSGDTDKEGRPIATYFKLDPDEPVRVASGADFKWAPGTRSPEAKLIINGQFTTVIMDRDAVAYEYSLQQKKTADIPIGTIYRQIAASQAMTRKTQRVLTLLESASNWSNNTADANTLNGNHGTWANASADEMSPNYNAVKRTLTASFQRINLATNSLVRPSMLRCVISPGLAADTANSGELTAYLKGSPFAREVQEGYNDFDTTWNLPKYYNGCEFVVEDASIVTSRRNSNQTPATTTRSYLKKDTSAVLLSRQGKVDGVAGSPSLSTVQLWYYRFEMSVMERTDDWHDIVEGKVIDQYKEVLIAPTTGFLITGTK
jgi:hypothetical protein